MSHISGSIGKIALLFAIGALLGLLSTVLAKQGADDQFPHARGSSGIVTGQVVVSGEWQWFRWLGPSVLRHDYSHRGSRWYGSMPGRNESRGELRGQDDSRRGWSRDDFKGRGPRRDGKDDNPGKSNRRGRRGN